MNNQNQLQKEIENIHVLMEKKASKDSTPILQAYKKALNNVRKELGVIYSKYSTDGKLNVSTQQRYSILVNMEQKLKSMAQELGNVDEAKTTEILQDVYKESYYRTTYEIQKGITTEVNWSIIRPEFIEHAVNMPIDGKTFSDRIWDNKTKLVNVLRDNIERGMIEGKSIDKLSKDIAQSMGSSAYESKRLINTELARCTTQAQKQIYLESGVVQKLMWSSALDSVVCEECAALDGQMWDINENHPEPPIHPEDRCCLIPIVNGWSPSTRYNQESGENIDYTNYEKWKENQNID